MTQFLKLIQSVSEQILSKKLLKPNQLLLVTISGGQDSVCLFLILLHLKNQWKLKIHTLYCNHLWQKDSVLIAKQLGKLTNLFKTPLYLTTTPSNILSEKKARDWRYSIFYRLATFSIPLLYRHIYFDYCDRDVFRAKNKIKSYQLKHQTKVFQTFNNNKQNIFKSGYGMAQNDFLKFSREPVNEGLCNNPQTVYFFKKKRLTEIYLNGLTNYQHTIPFLGLYFLSSIKCFLAEGRYCNPQYFPKTSGVILDQTNQKIFAQKQKKRKQLFLKGFRVRRTNLQITLRFLNPYRRSFGYCPTLTPLGAEVGAIVRGPCKSPFLMQYKLYKFVIVKSKKLTYKFKKIKINGLFEGYAITNNPAFTGSMDNCFKVPIKQINNFWESIKKLKNKKIFNPYSSTHISLITGHTSADKIETVLFNMIRGCGLKGFYSLKWKRSIKFEKYKNIFLNDLFIFNHNCFFFIINSKAKVDDLPTIFL